MKSSVASHGLCIVLSSLSALVVRGDCPQLPPGHDRFQRDQFVIAIADYADPQAVLQLLWDPLESTCRHASLSIL